MHTNDFDSKDFVLFMEKLRSELAALSGEAFNIARGYGTFDVEDRYRNLVNDLSKLVRHTEEFENWQEYKSDTGDQAPMGDI